MHFARRHWYEVGAVVAVGAVVWLVLGWHDMGVLRRLLLLNFIALLIHQFEEYRWPGGFPAVWNFAVQQSATPDRYPLNQNSALAINVSFAYGFYLVPVIFPSVIWLGLAPVLMGLMQFVVHGIIIPRKLGSIYNPGLVAVVLGHIPIGVYYLWYVHAHGLVTTWDWVLGITYQGVLTYVVMKKLGFTWLADRNSPFPFDDVEMKRFSVRERLERLGRSPAAGSQALTVSR